MQDLERYFLYFSNERFLSRRLIGSVAKLFSSQDYCITLLSIVAKDGQGN
jgi:hypothetical protein